MNATTQTAATIDINALTPEQLKAVRQQLKAQVTARAGNREAWTTLVDGMLQDKVNGEWAYTTADILTALIAAKLETEQTGDERAEQLKRIQTRKQKLHKADAANKDKYGFKPTAHGPMTLSADTVVDWLMTEGNVNKLSNADKKAILKQLA